MKPQSALSANEDLTMVNWLKDFLKRRQICKILPFKDGRPPEKWYSSFLKRHPGLVLRESEGLTTSRAIITEEYIRKWFGFVT